MVCICCGIANINGMKGCGSTNCTVERLDSNNFAVKVSDREWCIFTLEEFENAFYMVDFNLDVFPLDLEIY